MGENVMTSSIIVLICQTHLTNAWAYLDSFPNKMIIPCKGPSDQLIFRFSNWGSIIQYLDFLFKKNVTVLIYCIL